MSMRCRLIAYGRNILPFLMTLIGTTINYLFLISIVFLPPIHLIVWFSSCTDIFDKITRKNLCRTTKSGLKLKNWLSRKIFFFFQIFNFHFLCELVIYSLISSVSALLLTTPRTNLPKCRKWRTPSILRRRRKEKSSSWKPSWTRTERKRRKKRWRKSSPPWLSGKMSGDCNLKECLLCVISPWDTEC